MNAGGIVVGAGVVTVTGTLNLNAGTGWGR